MPWRRWEERHPWAHARRKPDLPPRRPRTDREGRRHDAGEPRPGPGAHRRSGVSEDDPRRRALGDPRDEREGRGLEAVDILADGAREKTGALYAQSDGVQAQRESGKLGKKA